MQVSIVTTFLGALLQTQIQSDASHLLTSYHGVKNFSKKAPGRRGCVGKTVHNPRVRKSGGATQNSREGPAVRVKFHFSPIIKIPSWLRLYGNTRNRGRPGYGEALTALDCHTIEEPNYRNWAARRRFQVSVPLKRALRKMLDENVTKLAGLRTKIGQTGVDVTLSAPMKFYN